MEIPYEVEMLGLNSETDLKKEDLRAIRVYPFDDDYVHYTFMVRECDFDAACNLLQAQYDEWERMYYESDADVKTLKFISKDALTRSGIKHTCQYFSDDTFEHDCNYYSIG